MKWISIKDEKPTAINDDFLRGHPFFSPGGVSILVYGYDTYNYYPRYEVKHINDVANGEWGGLLLTHWMKIEGPD